jgi:hypothetical protein
MPDSANAARTEVTYTVVELPLKSKRRRRTNKHHQKQEQPRTLRVHALHVSSGLVPSELLLSFTSTTTSTTTTPEEEEEEGELGQKRSRSDSDSDAQTQDSLPPPLPASSWLLAQKLAEHALTLAPSYVRKRLTREPLASLPQWSSREPQVLRVVARLNRLDPLRPRGMPRVATNFSHCVLLKRYWRRWAGITSPKRNTYSTICVVSIMRKRRRRVVAKRKTR